jgi:fatty-acid desaturase
MTSSNLSASVDVYGRKNQQGFNWKTGTVMAIFHILAIAAFFFIDIGAILSAVVLYVVSGMLGIGMSYHRLLTHGSYKTFKPIEYFLAVCATLSMEGGPIFWVATHRIHHQNSDSDGDPHTPREGGYWAHMGWILSGHGLHSNIEILGKYAPDLSRVRFYVWLTHWHWIPQVIVGLGLLVFGGIPYVLWGIFFRTTFLLHCTWLVNSGTHMWGSKRFNTRDDSTNNWWIALLTFGEGWHNNHHAHPTSARHGLAWYELDMNWIGIRSMQFLGLAWDVKVAQLHEAP